MMETIPGERGCAKIQAPSTLEATPDAMRYATRKNGAMEVPF